MSGNINIKSSNLSLGNNSSSIVYGGAFTLKDINSDNISQYLVMHNNGHFMGRIYSYGKYDNAIHNASIGPQVDQINKTTFCSCDQPRDNYSSDIVTTKYAKDHFVAINTAIQLYVGGSNASDTADLNNGRGLSPDKPFATLSAAFSYVSTYISSYREISLRIYDNIQENNNIVVRSNNINGIYIESHNKSNIKTIKCKGIQVLYGKLFLSQIKIEALEGTDNLFYVDGYSGKSPEIQFMHNVTVKGTVTGACVALWHGYSVVLYTDSFNSASSVTGKKYDVNCGSFLNMVGRGVNAIHWHPPLVC